MLWSVIAKNLNWEILTRIYLLLKDGMGVFSLLKESNALYVDY